MDLEKEGKQAYLQELNTTRYCHDTPKKGETEKALVTKEKGLGFLEKNIFIGDSAATSHMTSTKLGVYDLVPINGSVMIGNGKSISCTHKGKLGCHLQAQGWIHGQRNLGSESCARIEP